MSAWKSVESLHPKHEVQLMNYLAATGYKLGLLVNFMQGL